MHELIGDITICILFAWVLGLLAHFSRQPLILAYLIAGCSATMAIVTGPRQWLFRARPASKKAFRYARQRRSALRIDAGADP